jgi:hypothetical protein
MVGIAISMRIIVMGMKAANPTRIQTKTGTRREVLMGVCEERDEIGPVPV